MSSEKPSFMRLCMSKLLGNPIIRGIVGGIVGAYMGAVAGALPSFTTENPEWSIAYGIMASFGMGILGVLVAGIPAAAFGMGIGISEMFRHSVPKWLLWLWYLIFPSILSLGALVLLRYIPLNATEWLGLEVFLLGLAYMPVRVIETCILKKILSPFIGSITTALINLMLLFLAFVCIGDGIHFPSPLCVLLFFVVLFQRIKGGFENNAIRV